MKKFLYTLLLILLIELQTLAFEDYIIINNGKLTDIKIEDNTIIDVYPMITVSNNKNTLIIHPLKIGKTKFYTLKNNKDVILFDVEVKENETIINNVNGFEILAIDKPQNYEEILIDLPPSKFNWQKINVNRGE